MNIICEYLNLKTDNKKIISWKLREIKEKKLKNENLFKVKKYNFKFLFQLHH